MRFVSVDFETANFKRESICSIGLAVVEDFTIVKTMNKLIKPTPNYYENVNKSIHKINSEMTDNEPSFDKLWNDFKPYFENQQMVAHNASFDFSALRYVLNAYNIENPEIEYYCSMLISKKIISGLLNYQLPTVCEHLKINNLKHHSAESDAIACANIILELCKLNNVSSLQELSNRFDFSPGKIYPNSYKPFRCNTEKSLFVTQHFDFTPDIKDFDEEHPFFQKRVVFTGEISKISRNNAKKIVSRIGGIVNPEGLSSKTNYLVVGSYDVSKYGENYKSEKFLKAEMYISKGIDIEIISEDEFIKMIHTENISFEISVSQIRADSEEFLKLNIYNLLYDKKVYFTSDLSIQRTTAFQLVGDCGGYGHDYDIDEIPNSDYFVVSDKIICDLEKGIKNKSLIDFEQLRNDAQNRGNVGFIKILSESTLLEYMDRREKFHNHEIEMLIG